jgi:hypothetical protein
LTPSRALAVALGAALSAAGAVARAAAPPAGDTGAAETATAVVEARPPSIVAPPAPRDLTRAAIVVRPFLGLVGNSWGALGEARLEHYFARPFMLGVELSPIAVASAGEGLGAITHLRAVGAYVTDYLAVGLGVGARLQRFGATGLSLAPSLRLGSLDGLSFSVTYTHTIARNAYTGQETVGFSNLLSTLVVPLGRTTALELAGGLSLDAWAYGTVGLRQRLLGDGGRGTWFVSGAFGAAMVVDRAPCNYDSTVVCGASATSFGPTIGIGLDRRF